MSRLAMMPSLGTTSPRRTWTARTLPSKRGAMSAAVRARTTPSNPRGGPSGVALADAEGAGADADAGAGRRVARSGPGALARAIEAPTVSSTNPPASALRDWVMARVYILLPRATAKRASQKDIRGDQASFPP